VARGSNSRNTWKSLFFITRFCKGLNRGGTYKAALKGGKKSKVLVGKECRKKNDVVGGKGKVKGSKLLGSVIQDRNGSTLSTV